MILLPSLSKPFDCYYSKDPALHQCPPAPSSDASDEDKAAHKVAVEEYEAKLRAARQTGNWSALIKPNETPTRFVLDQIDQERWRYIRDRANLPAGVDGRIGIHVLLSLLFRLSIKDIHGLQVGGTAIKAEHKSDPEWDGWIMLSRELTTLLSLADQDIVNEIGFLVFQRLQETGPFGQGS